MRLLPLTFSLVVTSGCTDPLPSIPIDQRLDDLGAPDGAIDMAISKDMRPDTRRPQDASVETDARSDMVIRRDMRTMLDMSMVQDMSTEPDLGPPSDMDALFDMAPPHCIPTGEADVECDGVDDDCDGNLDEGFAAGERCVVGPGLACQTVGEMVCRGGEETCSAEEPTTASCSDRWQGRFSASGGSSCILGDDGVLRCWGSNSSGQLGRGNLETLGDEPGEVGEASIVAPVPGGIQEVSVGVHAVCVLNQNGLVYYFGSGFTSGLVTEERNLGDDPNEIGANARPIDLPERASSVSCGSGTQCALDNQGHLNCWGSCSFGKCGIGESGVRGDQPNEMGRFLPFVEIPAPVVEVVHGNHHACARFGDGRVKCWGRNDIGELGIGHALHVGDDAGEMEELPFVDLGRGIEAIDIAAAGRTTCAVIPGGLIKCWGANTSGQLGQGDLVNRGARVFDLEDSEPISVGEAVAVEVGTSHVCALLEGGSVKCWGRGIRGILGNGMPDDLVGDAAGEVGLNLPAVDLGGPAVALRAGGSHTCALLATGVVKCWGANDSGQLGIGHVEDVGDDLVEMGEALQPTPVPQVSSTFE